MLLFFLGFVSGFVVAKMFGAVFAPVVAKAEDVVDSVEKKL